jgi:glycosyltransferase involved in cell wall biosynthesis
MKKILWFSDSDGTGYANASHAILSGLIGQFEIYFFVLNSVKDLEYHQKAMPGYKVICYPKNEVILTADDTIPERKELIELELYSINHIPDCIRKIKPDICFIINDNGFIERISKAIRHSGVKTKIVGYMPIDCESFPRGFFKKQEDLVDNWITMTEFGKREIISTGFKKNVNVLHHPIDANIFYPLDKFECRKKLFGTTWEDTFIILNNNKNQGRKRIDLTVEAFAIFMSRHPHAKVKLLIKEPREILNDRGKDINAVITECKNKYYPLLDQKIIQLKKFFSMQELNMLYNACDLNINTTSGEGWGLVSCEAAITGNTAVLVPDNTSHTEIFEGIPDVLIPTETVSWHQGRAFKEDISKKIILCMQAHRNILDSGITESDGLLPKDYPFTFQIIVADTIKNPNLELMTINTGVKTYHTGTNKLSSVCDIVRKFKPEVFQVSIILGSEYSFVKKELSNFTWNVDGYKCTLLSMDSVKRSIEGYQIKVRLPKVEAIAEKIEHFYKNREQVNQKLRERMLYFNKERIGKELAEFLNKT